MPVKYKDYYETLGVAKAATPDDIKQAFRKLARIHHPDVAKNKVAGEAKFKEINEAYEVLGDTDKRAKYDELGPNWQDPAGAGGARGPAGPAPAAGPARRPTSSSAGRDSATSSNPTSAAAATATALSGARAALLASGGDFTQPGGDVEADIMVTLDEVLHGSKRKITLRRSSETGGADRTNSYNVTIPAGVHEGQRIRLAGQGSEGSGGAQAGDLYLRVRLARHPDLNVRGADLYYDLDLAPWEAVLGTSVTLPTLDGATTLKVPGGHYLDGKQLRLRGLGLPRGRGRAGRPLRDVQGSRFPLTVSAEERALWEKLPRAQPSNHGRRHEKADTSKGPGPQGAAEAGRYSIAAASELTGVAPELIKYYHAGESSTPRRPAKARKPVFDDDAIYELRRLEHYRRQLGATHHAEALVLIGGLLREVARLEGELRYHGHR